MEKGREGDEGGKREEGFCVASSWGDILHMSTCVLEHPPRSRNNVNLISSGLKEENNNPNYSSSYYGHERRQDP